jgi:hypothetical protein
MRSSAVRVMLPSLLLVIGIAGSGGAQAPAVSWKQAASVTASNKGEGDQFGFSLALSRDGNTLAVGSPLESSSATGINGKQTDDSAYSSGAVYVYTRSGSKWPQQAYVKASNTGENDQFGFAVALSADGNTLAVSAVYEDSGAKGINGNQADNSIADSGAVYIFTRSGKTWTQQAYIKASNSGEKEDGDTFGYTVALSGDGNTLAVGAPSEDSAAKEINGNQADNSASGAGAAYVFVRNGSAWAQQAYVKSPNARANTLFGYSVSLDNSGNTLAIGAFDEDDGRGALYIFGRTAAAWSHQARLQASNAERQDSMGTCVSISDDGNTVVAGALDEDSLLTGVNPGNLGAADQLTDTSAGAAYVFVRNGNNWTQQAFIKASNSGKEDWFGVRVALSGDGNTLVASAPNEDSAAKGIGGNQKDDSADEAGAAYVYERTGSTWNAPLYFKSSDNKKFAEFGSSVALNKDGRTMAVGARFAGGGGAVYIFTR